MNDTAYAAYNVLLPAEAEAAKSKLGAYTICNTLSNVNNIAPPCSTGDTNVKQCYKKLAVKTHPDKNPNDINAAEKFQDVNRAYTYTQPADQDKKCSAIKKPETLQPPPSQPAPQAPSQYDDDDVLFFNPHEVKRQPDENVSNYTSRVITMTLLGGASILLYNALKFFSPDGNLNNDSIAAIRNSLMGGAKGRGLMRKMQRQAEQVAIKNSSYHDTLYAPLPLPPRKARTNNPPINPTEAMDQALLNENIDITRNSFHRTNTINLHSVFIIVAVAAVSALSGADAFWPFSDSKGTVDSDGSSAPPQDTTSMQSDITSVAPISAPPPAPISAPPPAPPPAPTAAQQANDVVNPGYLKSIAIVEPKAPTLIETLEALIYKPSQTDLATRAEEARALVALNDLCDANLIPTVKCPGTLDGVVKTFEKHVLGSINQIPKYIASTGEEMCGRDYDPKSKQFGCFRNVIGVERSKDGSLVIKIDPVVLQNNADMLDQLIQDKHKGMTCLRQPLDFTAPDDTFNVQFNEFLYQVLVDLKNSGKLVRIIGQDHILASHVNIYIQIKFVQHLHAKTIPALRFVPVIKQGSINQDIIDAKKEFAILTAINGILFPTSNNVDGKISIRVDQLSKRAEEIMKDTAVRSAIKMFLAPVREVVDALAEEATDLAVVTARNLINGILRLIQGIPDTCGFTDRNSSLMTKTIVGVAFVGLVGTWVLNQIYKFTVGAPKAYIDAWNNRPQQNEKKQANKEGRWFPRLGAPRAVNGAPPAVNGAPPAVNEAPQAVNGAPQAVNGAPRAVNGALPAVNRAPAIMNGPNDLGGGKSRSRKRSACKRTRRKVYQHSKKQLQIKRRSSRKVRRYSRKGRK